MKPNRLLFLFSMLFVLFYSLSLTTTPSIAMDEGWFAFYSVDQWGLNPFSQLHSEIQYKLFFLYPMLCGITFKLFGISLTAMRFITVVSGLIGLIGIGKLTSKLSSSSWITFLGLLLYSTSNITLVTSRWGRPEGIVFTTLIWCIYHLYTGITDQKKGSFLWVGFLCSIMVLLHPFSLTSVIAISIIIILVNWKKETSLTLSFFIGALPLFIVFLINMFVINAEYTHLHLIEHMSERLVASESAPFFDRISYFVNSYTLGIKRLYILVFELGILLITAYQFRHHKALRSLSWIGLITFVLGLILITPFRRRYFGIVMMISIIMTCASLTYLQSSKLKKGLLIAICLYALNNMLGDIVYIYKHHTNTPYSTLKTKLQAAIPKGSRVATLIEFWIPLADYFTITNIHDFPIETYSSISDVLEKKGVDYVVYSDFLFENKSPTTGEAAIGYDNSKNTYLNAIQTIVVDHWPVISTIHTKPYGDITVYAAPTK